MILKNKKKMGEYIPFKKKLNQLKRESIGQQILNTYPERIPVILEPGPNTEHYFNRTKYLVPIEITFGKFINDVYKNRLELLPNNTIYFIINENYSPPLSHIMMDIYRKSKSQDGFLYITYQKESVFG